MKYFYYIFSIYIITLLAYPCQDRGDISGMNKIENSANNNHNDNDCHTCPPFCICNCCQVNTITVLKATIKAIIPIPIEISFFYKVISFKDIILSIWQPPKA